MVKNDAYYVSIIAKKNTRQTDVEYKIDNNVIWGRLLMSEMTKMTVWDSNSLPT